MEKIGLVLLPGLDGTGLLFADFVAALGPEFDPIVVRYSADIPLGYEELEPLVRRFLPTDKPFILLGESFGGPLSISIAASAPPGLVGLVLCCTFACYPRPVFRRMRWLAPYVPVAGALVTLARTVVSPAPVTPSLRAKLDQARNMVSKHVLRSRVGELLRKDFTRDLAKIDVPILDLRATRDGIVPNRAGKPIRRLGRRVQAVDVPGPHFLLLAKPAETAAIITNFAHRMIAAPQSHP